MTQPAKSKPAENKCFLSHSELLRRGRALPHYHYLIASKQDKITLQGYGHIHSPSLGPILILNLPLNVGIFSRNTQDPCESLKINIKYIALYTKLLEYRNAVLKWAYQEFLKELWRKLCGAKPTQAG